MGWRIVALMLLWGTVGQAFALDAPTGRVILEVGGRISVTNVEDEAHFDRAMLEALPQHVVVTGNPWIDGQSRFEGPLLSDLLAAVEAQGDELKVVAIKDYETLIPVNDALHNGVILAMRRDGERMRIRDKGPLFVVYPFDDRPELKTNIYFSRSAWQVARIDVN